MENYLYPFFWQHGENSAVLEEYMDKISESGMKACCIEARPHPDFVGDGWWRDVETILNKAKEHNMKLWILDDSHFPTGYANGRIEKDFPQYRKLFLYQRRFDVTGPMKGARINAGILMGRPWTQPGLGDKTIIGIYLAKRSSEYTQSGEAFDAIDCDSIVELKNAFSDNIITLDIPTGSYSVFVVFTTYEGGEEATKGYLNPLVGEATQVLIDEVYEPHFSHFGQEFGKTITAFFSDEPRFGNVKGPHATIGTDMVLPWRSGLENELPFDSQYLPLLWTNAGGFEHEIRFLYMDLITRLYSENFTGRLAAWCNDHGISYLGHNIEDEGAHCRLGYGPGHYFRAQKDQDYAGIDIIGTQLVPGMPYHHDAFSTGGNNGEFYHYALGKLAASAAHLDPKKKGRAMCEAFGAYGWNEGLKLMKWITDHLISRGINTLVPHAFNPKDFPDWDCAPHFYAHGHNPQFRYFKDYSDYTNRLMGLFNGGKTTARIGVLYNGMLEWYGQCMPIEKVLRTLTENQIDADIISEDYLDEAKVVEGCFTINGVSFEMLIVPANSGMPKALATKLKTLTDGGVSVVTIDRDVSLKELPDLCDSLREIRIDHAFRRLCYYHYSKQEQEILFFFNESTTEHFIGTVRLPEFRGRTLYRYDAFNDRYYCLTIKDGEVALQLAPYESIVLVARTEVLEDAADEIVIPTEEITGFFEDTKWNISYADAFAYPTFKVVLSDSEITALNLVSGFENKAGTVAYECKISLPSDTKSIDLGTPYETAEVFVNGQSAGRRYSSPYRFDIGALVSEGENTLRIEVTNTLGSQVLDPLSQYLVIEPFGLCETPKLFR